MNTVYRILALGSLVASISVPMQAEDKSWYDGIQINGMVSIGYTYNLNDPYFTPAGTTWDLNTLRSFDEDNNTVGVDVAELVIQKPLAEVGDAGFRVDLTHGSAVPEKAVSTGLLAGDVDLQQAYISYWAPIGSGIRLDIGKQVTHMGYEVIEGYDGVNDFYSRGLTFNYAIPFTQTGVRWSYNWTDWLSTMGGIANGWDQVEDVNTSKTYYSQISLKPWHSFWVNFNYIGGRELANSAANAALATSSGRNPNELRRDVFDVVAEWKPTKSLTLAGEYAYGMEDRSSFVVGGRDAKWQGISGFLKFNASDKLSLALRGEVFNDKDLTRFTNIGGYATYPGGVAANLPLKVTSVTFAPTYKFTDQFLVRLEGRWDDANRNVFPDNTNRIDDQQTTVAANAIFTF